MINDENTTKANRRITEDNECAGQDVPRSCVRFGNPSDPLRRMPDGQR
jgi:hypothetical protein